MAREHGPDAFADEDAVVGEEDGDCSHAPIQHHSTGAEGLGRGHPDVGDASHTPGRQSVPWRIRRSERSISHTNSRRLQEDST